MDRVLALIGLRLRLYTRRLRHGSGVVDAVVGFLVALAGLLFAVGLAAGFGIWLDYARIDGSSAEMAYLVAFYTFAFFALILPLLPGGLEQTFDVGRLRQFPIGRRRLFALHLGACLLGGEHLIYYPGLVTLAIVGGLLSGAQAVLAVTLFLLALGFFVIWNSTIGLVLVAVLRQRRLREVLTLVTLFLVLAVSLVPVMLFDGADDDSEISRSRLRVVGDTIYRIASPLPPGLAARGLAALHDGDPRGAAAPVIRLALWNVAGIALGFGIFVRYHLGDRGEAVPSERQSRAAKRSNVWLSFDSRALAPLPLPVRAVAAKDLRYLFRSVVGKFSFLIAPLVVIMVAFVLSRTVTEGILGVHPDSLVLYGMMLYASLFSTNFVYNAYAWEGEGIQAYFMAPVPARSVILGKNLAVMVFNMALFVVCMTAWMALVRTVGPGPLLTAWLIFLVAFINSLTWGNLTSVFFPVRRDAASMRSAPSQVGVVLSILALAVSFTLVGTFLGIPVLLGAAFLQPLALVVLLAGLIGVYAFVLGVAAEQLERRKEKIIASLEAER